MKQAIFGKLSFIALQISNSRQTKIIKQDKPAYQIVTVKQQFLFLFQYFIINKSITDTLFLIIIIINKSCRKLTKKPFLRSMKQAKQVKIRSNSLTQHINTRILSSNNVCSVTDEDYSMTSHSL